MRKVQIDFPPEKTIEINGCRFTVALSDFEALSLALGISKDFSELGAEPAAEKVIETVERAVGALDELLGKGSAERIIGGRTVDICFMLEGVVLPVFKAVLELSMESYGEKLEEYE